MASFNPPTQFQIGDWVEYPASPGNFNPKEMAGAGPTANFMVGWKVQASHFIVQALEIIQVATHYSKMAHWNARAGIKECKRMADAGPITNFMVGWKVQASHFIVAALGNHTSSQTLFQNGPLKRQGWHQGMQKDGRCWLNHQFYGGLKGWGQPFYSGSTWKSYK